MVRVYASENIGWIYDVGGIWEWEVPSGSRYNTDDLQVKLSSKEVYRGFRLKSSISAQLSDGTQRLFVTCR